MFHCENTLHPAADGHTCDWVAVRSSATSSLAFTSHVLHKMHPSMFAQRQPSTPKELRGNWLAKRCGLECVCVTPTGEKQHRFSNMAVTRQLQCCGGLPLCLPLLISPWCVKPSECQGPSADSQTVLLLCVVWPLESQQCPFGWLCPSGNPIV